MTDRLEAACTTRQPAHHRTWVGDTDGFVRLLDQTLLPTQVDYRDCRTVEEIWEAIRALRVRGAPAIGVAAAMGVVVGMQQDARERGDLPASPARSRPPTCARAGRRRSTCSGPWTAWSGTCGPHGGRCAGRS